MTKSELIESIASQHPNMTKKNIELALDGDVKSMDIGTINDTPFVYVVGMGKFMNVPYETKSADKKKNGYLAYLKEAFNEIAKHAFAGVGKTFQKKELLNSWVRY